MGEAVQLYLVAMTSYYAVILVPALAVAAVFTWYGAKTDFCRLECLVGGFDTNPAFQKRATP